MKKKLQLLSLAMILAVSLFGCQGCHSEQQPMKNDQLTLHLSISSLRVAATEANNNLKFTWQSGDVINLLFVQNNKKATAVGHIKASTINGATAEFEINVPINISTKSSYDLYGAVNATFDGSSTMLTLPTRPVYSSLSEVAPHAPLYFAITGQQGDNVTASIHHLSSVFIVSVENTTARDVKLKDITIRNAKSWSYSNSTALHYNLQSNSYTESATSTVTFMPSAPIEISGGSSVKLYTLVYPVKNLTLTEGFGVTARIDDKDFSGQTSNLPSGGHLGMDKAYGLKVTYDATTQISVSFVLPSMPIENLY